MSRTILVLRPQPGADETAARARALGLDPVVSPLFTVASVAWRAPDPSAFDAVLLTSANAVRHVGPDLAALASLACYAVGEATATAARKAGFTTIRSGPSDGAALLDIMASDGVRHVLHLCGRERIALAHPALSITPVVVYAADPVPSLPSPARAALDESALALIHSPRAGALFGQLCEAADIPRESIAIATISEAAAHAAGEGWKHAAVAPRPRDQALLELAAKLCQTGIERG